MSILKRFIFQLLSDCAYLGWTRNRRGKQYIVSYQMARIDVDVFMLDFFVKNKSYRR